MYKVIVYSKLRICIFNSVIKSILAERNLYTVLKVKNYLFIQTFKHVNDVLFEIAHNILGKVR